MLAMIEVFVYIMGLSIVLKNLGNTWNLIAYCVGYGTGVFMGSKIEEWLALGYVTVQIVVDSSKNELIPRLREQGYGVTCWLGDGRDGKRLVMQVLAKRSNEKRLYKTIQEITPKPFAISYEPKFFRGGFWVKHIGNK